jgi:cysteine desulfuration protein SufE
MSTVQVVALADSDRAGKVRFVGDCATAVIRGVLALLVDLMLHRTLAEIKGMDGDGLFARLQLEEHLSPNRHVGIYAIVDKMRERAATLR